MSAKMLGAFVTALALTATTVLADDELDDVMEGFETDDGIVVKETTLEEPKVWDLSGTASLISSYAFAQNSPAAGGPDYRGFNRLRGQINLQLDIDLHERWTARIAGRGFYDWAYRAKNRGNFSRQVLRTNEKEFEFQDLYIQGSPFDFMDVKFGRQIVNWGRSDNIRVIDVLNPLDNREPGLVDIKDLRLPVTMSRVDLFRGPWTLTGIAVHEQRSDEGPALGSEFFPAVAVLPGFPTPPLPDQKRANGGNDTEWGAALTGIFSGWDISFHWAQFFNERPYIKLVAPIIGPVLLENPRIQMFGITGNRAHGNWLFKTEAAHFDGLRFLLDPGRDRKRSDIMIGVEYAGINDWNFALEAVERHIHGFTKAAAGSPDLAHRNRIEAVARVTADMMNDRLHYTLVASFLSGSDDFQYHDDGQVYRFSVDYEWRDGIDLIGGIVIYEDGQNIPVSLIDHADRLFFEAKYHF